MASSSPPSRAGTTSSSSSTTSGASNAAVPSQSPAPAPYAAVPPPAVAAPPVAAAPPSPLASTLPQFAEPPPPAAAAAPPPPPSPLMAAAGAVPLMHPLPPTRPPILAPPSPLPPTADLPSLPLPPPLGSTPSYSAPRGSSAWWQRRWLSQQQAAASAAGVGGGVGAATPQALPPLPPLPTEWCALPPEVWDAILAALPAVDVARVQRTCRAVYRHGDNAELWQRLLNRDFSAAECAVPIAVGPIPPVPRGERGGPPARTRYGELYTTYRRNHAADLAALEARYAVHAEVTRANWTRIALDAAQFPVGIGGLGCGVLLTTVLAALRLLGVAAIPWPAVLSPLLLLPCLPLSCAALGAATEVASNRAPATSGAAGLRAGDQNNLVAYAASVRSHLGRRRGRRVTLLLYLLTAFFAVPGILIAGTDATAHAVGLVPLLLLVVCLWMTPAAGLCPQVDRSGICGCSTVGLLMFMGAPLALLMLAAIVLAAGTATLDATWVVAFLFIGLVGGVLEFGAPAVILVVRAARDGDSRAIIPGVAGGLLAGCLLALAFHILLSSPTSPSFAPVLAGLLVGAGAATACLSCWLAAFLCRRARSTTFTDLYSWGWRQVQPTPRAGTNAILPGARA